MAFEDVEQLLMTVGLDLTPVKKSSAEIKSIFDTTAKEVAVSIDAILKGIGQTGIKSATDFSTLSQAQKQTLEQLKISTQETIDAIKLSLAEESKKTGAIQEQVELLQEQIQLQKASFTQTAQATQATKQESAARAATQKEKVDALTKEVDLIRTTLSLNQRLTAELEKQVALMGRTPSKVPAAPIIAGEAPTPTPTFIPTAEEVVAPKPKASPITLLATAEAAELAMLEQDKQKDAGEGGGEHKKIGELLSDKSTEKQMDDLVDSVKKATGVPKESTAPAGVEPSTVEHKISTAGATEPIKLTILPVDPPIHIPAEPIKPVVLPIEPAVIIPVEQAPQRAGTTVTTTPISPVLPSPVVPPTIAAIPPITEHVEQIAAAEKQLLIYKQEKEALEQQLVITQKELQSHTAAIPLQEKKLEIEKQTTATIHQRIADLKATAQSHLGNAPKPVEEKKSQTKPSVSQLKAEQEETQSQLKNKADTMGETQHEANILSASRKQQVSAIEELNSAQRKSLDLSKEEINSLNLQKKAISDQITEIRLKGQAGSLTKEQVLQETLARRQDILAVEQSITKIRQAAQAEATSGKEKLESEKAVLAQLDKELVIHDKLLAKLKSETAELSKKAGSTQKELDTRGKERQEGVLGKLSEGIFGGGLAGKVARGAIGGTFAATAITSVTYEVAHLIEKLKETTVEAGRISLLNDQFERLAKGSGIDATEMLEKMTDKTEGLVEKEKLLQVATAGLRNQKDIGLKPEQLIELTGAVSQLAEASGKRAVDGVEALSHAFARGRPQMLAYVTGLNQNQLRTRDIAPTASPIQRQQAEFQHAYDVIISKAQAVPVTLEQSMKRIQVASQQLFTEFAGGFNEAAGSKVFFAYLDELAKKIRSLIPAAKQFGDAFGVVLAAITPGVMLITELIEANIKQMLAVGGAIGAMFGNAKEGGTGAAQGIIMVGAAILGVKDALLLIETVVTSIIKILTPFFLLINDVMSIGLSILLKDFTSAAQLIDDFKTHLKSIPNTLKDVGKDYADWWKQGAESQKKFVDTVRKEFGKQPPKKVITPSGDDDTNTIRDRLRLAREMMQAQQALAKFFLQQREEEIQQEKQLDQESYQDGEEALDQHYANQRKIALEAHEARLEAMEIEHAAVLKNLKFDLDEQAIKPADYKVKVAVENIQYGGKVVAENKHTNAEIFQLNRQAAADERAARIKEIESDAQLETKAIENAAKIRETQFRTGEIQPESFVQQQIKDAEEIVRIQVDAAQQTYIAQADKLTARQELETKVQEAIAQGEQKLLEIREGAIDKYLSYIEKVYAPREQAMEAQIQFQQQQGPENASGFTQSTSAVIEEYGRTLEAHRKQLEAAAKVPDISENEWLGIYNQIEQIYQTQVKWHDELARTKDLLQPLGTGLASIAESMGQVFHSKSVQNIADVLRQGAEQLQHAREAHDKIFGKQAVPKSPAMIELETNAKGMFSSVTTATNQLKTPFNDLAEILVRVRERFAQFLDTTGQLEAQKASGVPVVNAPINSPETYLPGMSSVPPTEHHEADLSAQMQSQLMALGSVPSTALDAALKNSQQSFTRVMADMKSGKDISPAAFLTLLQTMEGQIKTLTTGRIASPSITSPTSTTLPSASTLPTAAKPATIQVSTTPNDAVPALLRELSFSNSEIVSKLQNGIQVEIKGGIKGDVDKSLQLTLPTSTFKLPAQIQGSSAFGVNDSTQQKSDTTYDSTMRVQINLANSGNILNRAFAALKATTEAVEQGLKKLVQPGNIQQQNDKSTGSAASAQGSTNVFGKLADEFGAIFKSGQGKYGPDEGGSYGSAGEALGAFTTSLTAAVSGVASFVQTILSAKSPLAGAIGGATSGMSLASSLGLGPIGTGIGAAIGAALGGITGEKNRRVQANIDNATANFKQIMGDFALNNNNLQQTVTSIKGIIDQLQMEKSQSKKGGSQFDQAINQYQDQMLQLQTQQTQTMISMYQQTSLLTAPQGMQDMLGTMQSMLKQYEQFVGAARDTRDLAEANQFLAESLSNLETNAMQQFNQDETQAIQDALQLNDLLYQRQDLIKQYNDQVQGILSQGVLTRQLTMAQSKGQQVEKLSADYQRQMEQMNEQISVAQYRVQAESQIFQLATTRTDLEMQLATVQKQAVDMDMLRISALTQLVEAFRTGDFSFGPIQDIINSLQGVTNSAVGVSGGNINNVLSNALDALISGAYQDRSVSGYATFRGQGF